MQAAAPTWVKKTAEKTGPASQSVLVAYYLLRIALLIPVLMLYAVGQSLRCFAIALRNRLFKALTKA